MTRDYGNIEKEMANVEARFACRGKLSLIIKVVETGLWFELTQAFRAGDEQTAETIIEEMSKLYNERYGEV